MPSLASQATRHCATSAFAFVLAAWVPCAVVAGGDPSHDHQWLLCTEGVPDLRPQSQDQPSTPEPLAKSARNPDALDKVDTAGMCNACRTSPMFRKLIGTYAARGMGTLSSPEKKDRSPGSPVSVRVGSRTAASAIELLNITSSTKPKEKHRAKRRKGEEPSKVSSCCDREAVSKNKQSLAAHSAPEALFLAHALRSGRVPQQNRRFFESQPCPAQTRKKVSDHAQSVMRQQQDSAALDETPRKKRGRRPKRLREELIQTESGKQNASPHEQASEQAAKHTASTLSIVRTLRGRRVTRPNRICCGQAPLYKQDQPSTSRNGQHSDQVSDRSHAMSEEQPSESITPQQEGTCGHSLFGTTAHHQEATMVSRNGAMLLSSHTERLIQCDLATCHEQMIYIIGYARRFQDLESLCEVFEHAQEVVNHAPAEGRWHATYDSLLLLIKQLTECAGRNPLVRPFCLDFCIPKSLQAIELLEKTLRDPIVRTFCPGASAAYLKTTTTPMRMTLTPTTEHTENPADDVSEHGDAGCVISLGEPNPWLNEYVWDDQTTESEDTRSAIGQEDQRSLMRCSRPVSPLPLEEFERVMLGAYDRDLLET